MGIRSSSMMVLLSLIFFCFISLPFNIQLFVVAVDNISPNQTLTDNGQTLVSFRNTFELGFFSPLNSNNRYIGIWFRNVPTRTAVWVANGNNPLPPNSSAVLSISPTGNILITGNDTRIVWSSSSSSITVRNPILQLLDNGNLVVINENNSGNYVWQSFDHPCDTLIPGMRFGWNLRTNQEWYLTSWRSLQDPSSGEYTYRMSPRGLPQIVLRRDSQITYRSGPWDGVRFGGAPVLQQNPVFRPIVVFNSDYVYYAFEDTNNSSVSRFVVNQTGQIQHLVWSQSRNIWVDIATLQSDTCDTYGACGPNGICTVNGNPICDCPNGFVPRLPQDWWEALDFSGGCVQRPLNCSEPQGFRRFARMKLPDISYFVENGAAMDQVACEDACMRNCSCVAYARTEINECVVWFGNLLDVRMYNEGGQDLYIRMAASELGSSNNTRRRTAIIASVPVILGVILLGLISWYVYRKRIAKRTEVLNSQRLESPSSDNNESIGEDDLELPLFDFPTISTATNSFSFTNKIGEGGFGPVYKGVLSDGQEIAVKRLSKDSGQGLGEFKNEIILITKLQHRNLVRVLGCCIRRSERMLIYEYMPNKSLEMFIFNETRRVSLDWGKRFDIIVGIARGLLYLHRDSRLRIIHRDLKASNILLDGEMNPKISDFGLARTFGGDQSEENTNRVVGTYGYMSPEYAIDGLFSVKSDVFSFGVLVLEILSGMKNRGFIHPDHDLNLLGHAWKLWNERKPMNLMDALIRSRVSESEVLRCIQVGLLCVQQRPEDRPTMSTVLLMLDSENPMLPQPKQPGFYTERFPGDAQSSSTGKKPFASNEVTITLLHGR